MGLITRCRLPKDIVAVTEVNRDAEVPPRSVGVDAQAVATVWKAVESLYRTGIHPAIQICVRRHGEVLIDRAIGHAAGNGPDDPAHGRKVPVTTDTLFDIFSASKAVTAMVIHLLDERRLVHLNDRVCEYIPEFARHGKDAITIQHVLTHRAGIPSLPAEAMRLETLEKGEEEALRLLCDTRLTWRPGQRLAYHAITGGFVLGGIVKRVTGKSIRTVLAEEILRPLGFRFMNYGVPVRDVPKVATNYFTGPPVLPPVSNIVQYALGVQMERAVALTNDQRYLTAVVPAGNVISSANELSRFYQLLLNGGTLDGVTVFNPRTIRHATQEQSYLEFDLTLVAPIRYGMGFMLGGTYLSMYGPDTPNAFGHLGFTNVFSWADPDRQTAVALMTSGKPILYPGIYKLYNVLKQIGLACPKARPRRQGQPRRAVRRLH